MTSGLENLFGQILFSEQKAQERRSRISDVKTKIHACQEEIKEAEEETEKYQGQLVLKTRQRNELKLKVTWQTRKEEILTEQKNKLQAQNKCLREKLENVSKSLAAEQTSFMGRVHKFGNNYNLVSRGEVRRQSQRLDQIRDLQHQEQQLHADLARIRQTQAKLETLKIRHAEYLEIIDNNKSRMKELEVKLNEEKKEIQKLLDKKQRVSKIPQTDPEFRRLQKELDTCRDTQMESVCLSLQQELHALQQRQWQRQLQHKKEAQLKKRK